MDIFTTQLARVVPVPIKPTSLKVKALVKEAATGKLSQDPYHLENHNYYFTNEEENSHNADQEQANQAGSENSDSVSDEVESNTEKKPPKAKHLDLYA